MENNKVIQIIIEFIKGIQSENKRVETIDDGVIYAINNPHYLLGQIIRQYSIPWNHYFISENAKSLWESITDENMKDYWYRNQVFCKKENNVIIEKYKGASKTPFDTVSLSVGQWFYYREVFHDEHIVTITDIIDELVNLENVDKENVIRVLDKIYVCRMLKSEDRNLYPKKHRSTNYIEVLNGPYKNCGINVIKNYFND